MFISKTLLFLELQKTGGSHILKLLNKFVEGEVTGKHNRLSEEYLDRFIIGSIRNPWDWYVSLWAYGVSGHGAIRSRVTKGVDFDYYYRMLPKSMGKNWLSLSQISTVFWHDIHKPTAKWLSSYQDFEVTSQFRAWLKMILDKNRRFDFGEGFAFSPLSVHAGLMSYRYLRLFTLGNKIYSDKRLSSEKGLMEFDEEMNISSGTIRTENLEKDFIQLLDQAGHSLSEEQTQKIYSMKKTNTSKRNHASYYYDKETLDLVAAKEKFLINKFQYQPPELLK